MWPWGQIAAWARRKDPFLPSALSPSHCPTLKNKLCTLSANQLGNSWKFTSLPGRERRKWRGETLACAAGDRQVRQMQERVPWQWRCRGRTRGGVGKRRRWGEVQLPRSQTAAGHVGTLCRHFRVQHRLPGLSARMLPFHDLAASRLSNSKSQRIPPKDLPGVSKREGQGGEGGGGIRLSRNSIAPVAAPTARPPTNRNTVRCGASHVRIQSKVHPSLSLLPPPSSCSSSSSNLATRKCNSTWLRQSTQTPQRHVPRISSMFQLGELPTSSPIWCKATSSLSPLWDGACTPSSTMVKGACGGCRTWQCPGTGVLWQSPGGICQRCAKFRPRRGAWHPCPQTFSQQGMPRCASGPRGTVFLGVIDCRGENARGAGASKHHSQAPLDP